MDLLDILTAKTTIVENDDEWDEMEEDGAKQGDVIRKILVGLSKIMDDIDEDVIGDVLFGGTSAAAADNNQSHVRGMKVFSGILGAYGVSTKDIKAEDLAKLFKDLGLSRGEAEYVADQQ
jgi:hypothetical protein